MLIYLLGVDIQAGKGAGGEASVHFSLDLM